MVARGSTENEAGVYLLRRRGDKSIAYVGSSVPGLIQRRRRPFAFRLWKTMLRHFHACAPSRAGAYAFGSDNWCKSGGADDWEVAFIFTPADAAREVEARAIKRYRPSGNAEVDRKTSGAPAPENAPF